MLSVTPRVKPPNVALSNTCHLIANMTFQCFDIRWNLSAEKTSTAGEVDFAGKREGSWVKTECYFSLHSSGLQKERNKVHDDEDESRGKANAIKWDKISFWGVNCHRVLVGRGWSLLWLIHFVFHPYCRGLCMWWLFLLITSFTC